MAWGEVLRKALKASMKKDAPLIPGTHCRWCEAAKTCGALTNKTKEIVKADFSQDPGKKRELKVPETEAELAKAAAYIPMIRAWIRATEKSIVQNLMAKKKLPDLKMVAKKSNRKLRDDYSQKKLIKKLRGFGIDEDDMFEEKKLLGVPQLEKLVPPKRRKDFNDELVVKPPGAPTYAHVDDKRPALDPQAAARLDFADEDDEE